MEIIKINVSCDFVHMWKGLINDARYLRQYMHTQRAHETPTEESTLEKRKINKLQHGITQLYAG